MSWWIWRDRGVQASAVALLVAVTAVGWASSSLAGKDPTAFGQLSRAESTPSADPTPLPGYGLDRVMGAVGKDPFHPDRRRPAKRFQLPEDQAALAARQRDTQSAGSVRLIGTAVTADGGGFAMCTLQGGTPRIVRIGEHVGSWTLIKVTQGTAEFTTPAGSVLIRVPKPGEGT